MGTRETDPLAVAAAWLDEGRAVALATVVDTWRSAPCPSGSHLAVDGLGRFAGSVSGGCVESAVIECAGRILAGESPRELEFGVTREMAWEVGLPCGGTIRVWVNRADPRILARVLAARASRESLEWHTDLVSGHERLEPCDDPQPPRVVDRTFVQPILPRPRLILIGGVHLAQHVARLARDVGFDVIVVEPRAAFAHPSRFDDVDLVDDWPESALPAIGIDRRTAVVTLAHDARLDDPALAAALRSEAFYVGALGGRKTQRGRRERLAAEGFDEATLARISGPVGLDIGAQSVEEIALSIVAELVARRRGG